MNGRILTLSMLTVAVLGGVPAAAHAMDPDFSDDVATCGFPSVVGINGPNCQGAYIGRGLIVTAAHCVDELGELPATVMFGDSYGNSATAELVYEGVECELHSSWSGEAGVDLAICNLGDSGLDVPVVPMTPPDGCEVSYLRHILRNHSSCDSQTDFDCYDGIIGVHASAGPSGNAGSGPKRVGESAIVRQTSWEGSPSMLLATVPGAADDHLQSGDSGAPYFMQMPDDSWRLLGVHSGRLAGTMYTQAVPPHIGFIEQAAIEVGSFLDATPCHVDLNGWQYDPGMECVDVLHVAAETPNADWSMECRNPNDFGGGADGCGGWFMGIAQQPNQDFHSPDVTPSQYDEILASVKGGIKDGDIPCRTQSIEAALREAGEYVGWWPFITDPAIPRDTVQLYDEAARDAVELYQRCQ